jgi:hypothetical protein
LPPPAPNKNGLKNNSSKGENPRVKILIQKIQKIFQVFSCKRGLGGIILSRNRFNHLLSDKGPGNYGVFGRQLNHQMLSIIGVQPFTSMASRTNQDNPETQKVDGQPERTLVLEHFE